MPTELTKTEIYRYVAKDKVLEITDLLAFAPAHSKIGFSLTELDETNRPNCRVRFYMDADNLKLVCHELLNGVFTAHEASGGTVHDDCAEARTLSLRKEAKYRQPFVLRIDAGVGEVCSGEIKMVKATESVTVQMPEFEARKMALVVLDYIRAWEIVHFCKCQDARTVTFTNERNPQ